MLAMFDIGNLIGAPLVGGILHWSRIAGLPPYTTMYVTVSTLIALMAGAYFWRTRQPAAVVSKDEFADLDVRTAVAVEPAACAQPATTER